MLVLVRISIWWCDWSNCVSVVSRLVLVVFFIGVMGVVFVVVDRFWFMDEFVGEL